MSPLTRIALLCVFASLTAACTGYSSPPPPAQHRKIIDDGVVMPTIRIERSFGQTASANGAEIGRGGLTFEATRAAGDTDPSTEYSMLSAQLLGRFRFLDEPRVRGNLLFGLQYVYLDAEIGSFGRTRSSFGPTLGLDVGLPIVGTLEAYGHGTVSAMLEATTSVRGELGLRAFLGGHTSIFAGYRLWKLRQEDDNSISAPSGPVDDLEIRTEGLVIGMGFRF